MNRGDFVDLLKDLQAKELSINQTKGVEYAGRMDALRNFKQIASLLNQRPQSVCMVYMTKHFLAIANCIAEQKTLSDESFTDRIADLRLYAALLLALIEEERSFDNG